MAYAANVLPIMIASPSDVTDEREIIRSVIRDWNDVNARQSKLILEAVGWETHSSPELGIRPQSLINERILRDCDLLVGVFWTRVGTPTGVAVSGTVEEIEEHVDAGKPAMIYFCRRPVAPDSLDPIQYESLKDFQSKCVKLGLVRNFDSQSELRSMFHKDLSICLLNNDYIKNLAQSGGSEPDSVSAIQVSLSEELSEDAIEILVAAASTEQGMVFKMNHMGGKFIKSGDKSFGGAGRDAARWESALNELVHSNLLVARGYKDQIFELTYEGWRLAESFTTSSK